ncbi:MAG: transposase [Bacteroidia bacterium]|nr:transposase [Bacteroidia bacterium]
MGLKSITEKDGIYFITPTVVDWVDVFSKPVYKNIIIESLRFCQQEKGLEIYAWVIMTNHLHLVVSAKEGFDLAAILRDFKKFTSKQIVQAIQLENESRKTWILNRFEYAGKQDAKIKDFKFWQDGNEPKPIYSNEFMKQKIDYIHQNPVKAEIVNEAEHYRHSSAIDYAGGKGLLNVSLAW